MASKTVFGLTMSLMLLSAIAVITAPAFALHKTQMHKFDTSTLPEKGTQYVLTISGTAKSMKQERGPFKASATNPTFKPLQIPFEGKILIKVDERMSLNPTVVRFVVESGYIEMANKVYTIDSGFATYHNRFTLGISSGHDLTIDVQGGLSGGIPTAEKISNINNYRSSLKIGAESWLFNGSIIMTKFL